MAAPGKGEPRYLQIAGDLRASITSGERGPGSRLPGENDLMTAYQVAREIDEGDRIVVGVNKFATDGEEPYQPLRVDPAIVTLGEVCDALRVAWDEYHPSEM